jgi:hypothetical protein
LSASLGAGTETLGVAAVAPTLDAAGVIGVPVIAALRPLTGVGDVDVNGGSAPFAWPMFAEVTADDPLLLEPVPRVPQPARVHMRTTRVNVCALVMETSFFRSTPRHFEGQDA